MRSSILDTPKPSNRFVLSRHVQPGRTSVPTPGQPSGALAGAERVGRRRPAGASSSSCSASRRTWSPTICAGYATAVLSRPPGAASTAGTATTTSTWTAAPRRWPAPARPCIRPWPRTRRCHGSGDPQLFVYGKQRPLTDRRAPAPPARRRPGHRAERRHPPQAAPCTLTPYGCCASTSTPTSPGSAPPPGHAGRPPVRLRDHPVRQGPRGVWRVRRHPRRPYWSVADPATGNYDVFRKTAADIDTRVRHLLPVLAAYP